MHAGVSPTDHPAPLQLHPSLPEPEVTCLSLIISIRERKHSSKISSGFQHLALLDVGGHPQSRYGRAYSLREDVVVTLPVTMEILSVRAVKTSCLSRALPPECWSHHSLVFSLQAGPRGELAWRCPKNGSVLPCEFGPLCLSADSTRCQLSETLVQIQIEETVPPQIQLPFWTLYFQHYEVGRTPRPWICMAPELWAESAVGRGGTAPGGGC